jgi:hypothetical protein
MAPPKYKQHHGWGPPERIAERCDRAYRGAMNKLLAHPHFTMPDGSIEVIELIPVPGT